jgi:hypothetical protein
VLSVCGECGSGGVPQDRQGEEECKSVHDSQEKYGEESIEEW